MTEVNFIDGQQLTPSSFGETDTQTGVWQPKAYSGSYGTNGFYLNFSDNSNTTAATLGKDYSGNGNNWTPNGFLVSAGPNNDSLVDSPTSYGVDTGVGGTVRGNYATLNAVNSNATLSNGNLDGTTTFAAGIAYATFGVSSGKWYWEVVGNSSEAMIGIGKEGGLYDFRTATGYGYYSANGQKYTNGTGSSYGATYATGNTIGVALDMDAGTLTFYKNGTSQGVAFSGLSGTYFPNLQNSGAGTLSYTFNFGQRPFAYTAPSGFKALCTQNLPTPTIGATTATLANKYFDVVLRNGGAPSGGTYSTTVNMSNGYWLWEKPRNQASSNYVFDVVRGNAYLRTDQTAAEVASTWFSNFGSNSFTTNSLDWGSSVTIVDWILAANGSGSTNTSGSITSTVSANTTSGFSVVTYTGTGATSGSVGHGLGVTPSMMINKSRSVVGGWDVYHSSNVSPNGSWWQNYLQLNSTAATASFTSMRQPSSTLINLPTTNDYNGTSTLQLWYVFAEVAGYSKFGSYTGNGSTAGPFVYTGFRPRYIMIKASTTVSNGNWMIFDTTRNTYNTANAFLRANLSDAEGVGGAAGDYLDILSNGFKLTSTPDSINGSGSSYIFMAFAESPFKYSLAR
jgi:hypothetical protein